MRYISKKVVLVSTLLLVSSLLAEEPTFKTERDLNEDIHNVNFGGVYTEEGELKDRQQEKKPVFNFDDYIGVYSRWEEENLNDKDLYIFGHYAANTQHVSKTINDTDEDSAASGVFRIFGMYDVFKSSNGIDKGTFVVAYDYRHAYTDISVSDLSNSIGLIGRNSLFYDDSGSSLIYLKYQQSFNNGNTGLVIGRYDPNDYQNVLGYVNPWETFTNLSVMLDSSVAYADSSWGIAGGHWLNDQWYVLGGINDANGLATDSLEFFQGGAEFYTYLHVGWTPSKKERYSTNIHMSTWHVDKRESAGVEESYGATLGASWTFYEKLMVFSRLGYSRGSAPIYNKTATLGTQYQFQNSSNQIGIAYNWGDTAANLGEQGITEMFYKLQLAKHLTLTPGVQYINNPALNPEKTDVWITGIRSRVTF